MIENLSIREYRPSDNAAALALEAQCTQGESVKLSFHRRTFHLRSELYEQAKIYAAFANDQMIGTFAGAIKPIQLNGKTVRAGYIYDGRVLPQFRRQGVAKTLAGYLIEQLIPQTEVIYALVAGQNHQVRRVVDEIYRPQVIIPLRYVLLPVYRQAQPSDKPSAVEFSHAQAAFMQHFSNLDFYCAPPRSRLRGYLGSYELRSSDGIAGCSVWTNRDILAERVEHLPRQYAFLRKVFHPLRRFVALPHVPQVGEFIRSWFLFDFYANSPAAAESLLGAINNLALAAEMHYLYLLLQESNLFYSIARAFAPRWFSPMVPYFLLARGRALPKSDAEIYIDIRDL